MKVYIVYIVYSVECDWETDQINEGVFSSREKAMTFVKKNWKNLEKGFDEDHVYSKTKYGNSISIRIREYKVQ